MLEYNIVSLHLIAVLLISEYYSSRWNFENNIIFGICY